MYVQGVNAVRPFPSDRGIVVAAMFVAGWALFLGGMRWFGETNGEPNVRLAGTALAAPYVTVAALALAGALGDRPWLLAAAGAALMPMSVMLFSPATLPLLFPAAFFVMRGFSDTSGWPRAGVIAAIVAAVMLVAAPLALFVHEDAAEWETPSGGGAGTSNTVTRTESFAALALSAGAIAVAALGSGAVRHPGVGPRTSAELH